LAQVGPSRQYSFGATNLYATPDALILFIPDLKIELSGSGD
jgi:hypothetical protein